VLRLVDEGTPDDKIIAVPLGEPQFADVNSYQQISPHVIREIGHFFETYKTLEGKDAHSEGWDDAEAARGVVEAAVAAFAR
jgi:inorganic pyrophosphatase